MRRFLATGKMLNATSNRLINRTDGSITPIKKPNMSWTFSLLCFSLPRLKVVNRLNDLNYIDGFRDHVDDVL